MDNTDFLDALITHRYSGVSWKYRGFQAVVDILLDSRIPCLCTFMDSIFGFDRLFQHTLLLNISAKLSIWQLYRRHKEADQPQKKITENMKVYLQHVKELSQSTTSMSAHLSLRGPKAIRFPLRPFQMSPRMFNRIL